MAQGQQLDLGMNNRKGTHYKLSDSPMFDRIQVDNRKVKVSWYLDRICLLDKFGR